MEDVFMVLPVSTYPLPRYNSFMKQKSLIDTNRYMRDPEKFRKALIRSVASSTAIETGATVASIARMLEETAKPEPLTTPRGSAR